MANKNVGDAFLLSWKLCDGTLEGYATFLDTPDDESRERANETVRYGHSDMLAVLPMFLSEQRRSWSSATLTNESY